MPVSKKRANRGRGRGPTAVVKRDHRAALVTQRTMEVTINELDRLIVAASQPYNDADMFAVTENHHQAREVVRFLIEHKICDALAALSGGDMIVTTEEPASVGVEVIEPAAEPVENPAAPYVWMAVRRTGLDYHEYDPAAPRDVINIPTRTYCGRSTASPTSVMLPRDGVVNVHRRCPRCADALAAEIAPTSPALPARAPGAGLGDLAGAPGPVEPLDDHAAGWATDVATLEAVAAGLRPQEGPPARAVMGQPDGRMCPRCGKRTAYRQDGHPYAHIAPDGIRCYGYRR